MTDLQKPPTQDLAAQAPPPKPLVPKWAVGVAGPVLAACLGWFWWLGRTLSVENRLPDATLFLTPSRLASFFNAIGFGNRRLYLFTELGVDMAFALSYGVLLSAAIQKLWPDETTRPLAPSGIIVRLLKRIRIENPVPLAALPLLAARADLLENLALASLALLFPSLPVLVVALVATVAIIKFVFLGVSLLLLSRIAEEKSRFWSMRSLLLVLWWVGILFYSLTSWIAVVPALALLFYLRKEFYVSEYAFFLRVPLLLALALLLFPALAPLNAEDSAGSAVRNLFVVESYWGLASVSAVVGFLSLTIMWVMRLTFLTAPARTRLPLERLSDDDPRPSPAEAMERNRTFAYKHAPLAVTLSPILFAMLGLPLLHRLWTLSTSGESPIYGGSLEGGRAVGWIAFGQILCLCTAYICREFYNKSGREGTRPTLRESGVFQGFGGQGHRGMMLWMGILSFTYVVGYLLEPGEQGLSSLPALTLVVLLVIITTSVLSLVAVIVDKGRISLLLSCLMFLVLVHQVLNSDYYYRVVQRPEGTPALPTAREAVASWHLKHPEVDYITVVAISGGGIKASAWTARALQGVIQADTTGDLGASVVLLSSNSGGGIGALYFTDSYRNGSPPDADKLSEIVDAAGQSSLSAGVWGMTYWDLWRVILGRPLWDRTRDRGWALEQTFEVQRRQIAGSDSARHFADWAEDVRRGERPAHIFSTTVVESGASLRFGSVELSAPSRRGAPGSQPQEFWELYGGLDVSVATAARLSASFPWISPAPRPWLLGAPDSASLGGNINGLTGLRLADGGYFDNFGVFSAIQFLRDVDAKYLASIGINKVLFVEVRASPEQDVPETEGGLAYDFIGPLIATNNVRSSSQIARNGLEVALLRENWASDSVRVVSVAFDLCATGPHSWHLSQSEQNRIVAAWTAREERRLRTALAALHGGTPIPASPPCQTGTEPET